MSKILGDLKKAIIDEIIKSDSQAALDETLVDEILFNIHLASKAKADILRDGYMQNVSTNPAKPYYQVSGAVSTYTTAIKNINSICTLLGIDKKSKKMVVDIANKPPEKDALDMILEEDNE